MTPIDCAVVLGTYNRISHLKRAIGSIRAGMEGVRSYRIVVVDGGSIDGSIDYLAGAKDVELIRQSLPLTGAVAAFNLGFGWCVEHGVPFVAHLNDDAEVATPRLFQRAIDHLVRQPRVGEVAFAFDLRGAYGFDEAHKRLYANFGLIRLEAGMAVAQAQGDPDGKLWWNPIYKTYGADTEFGMWLHKLGYGVAPREDLKVHDTCCQDALRIGNNDRDRADSMLFWSRWPDEQALQAGRPPHPAAGFRTTAPRAAALWAPAAAAGHTSGRAIEEVCARWKPLTHPKTELPELLAEFGRCGARSFLEVGTYEGATAAVVALTYPEAMVVTIDRPDPEFTGTDAHERSLTGIAIRELGLVNVHQHIMNSSEMERLLRGQVFSLVYVDGDASQEQRYLDLLNAATLLDKKGVIVTSGYHEHDDTASPAMVASGRAGAIRGAVQRFCKDRKFTLRQLGGSLVRLERAEAEASATIRPSKAAPP